MEIFNSDDLRMLRSFDHAVLEDMISRCQEPGLAAEFLQLHVPVNGAIYIPPPHLQGEKRLLYVFWHFACEHKKEITNNKCKCVIL